MKARIIIITAIAALMSVSFVFAQSTTEKFKVYGNCGMCEKRIEKAANSVEGVSSADWDKTTKMIEVTFDKEETNVHKVHTAIAKAGHDTEMHKASEEAYSELPGCCQYERAESKEE